MQRHILIIGGTGMLFQASALLASKCEVLTAIARTEESLCALRAAVARTGLFNHMLRLDWSDANNFFSTLEAHARAVGPPSLVVVWLHEESLVPRLAHAVSIDNSACEFYHVRSSEAAALPCTELISKMPRSVVYHEVILGFSVESGRSRWLLDAQICAGVLGAIERRSGSTIIGTIEPWENRPS